MALGKPRGDSVALSDDEQRALAEIEQGLIADDARLAESVQRRRMGIPSVVWVLGVCFGLGCVVFGVVIAGVIGTVVALVGFVVVVSICAAVLWSHRRRRGRPPHDMAA
jgi:Flp pilus assembly protein TadB